MKDKNMRKKAAKKCDNRSAGVCIYNENAEMLLIKRMKVPFGWAAPAGHCDKDGKNFRKAAKREIKEEVGLKVRALKLLLDKKLRNSCRRGGKWHHWNIFWAVKWSGKVKRSKTETKGAKWFSRSEVGAMAKRTEMYLKGDISERAWKANPGLEVVWYRIFKLLKMI